MPLLDNVKQMKASGMQDAEINQQLREQGYSPKEVDDALNQSRIKAAVSQDYEQNGQYAVINNQEMQPGIMAQEYSQAPPQPQNNLQQSQEYSQPSQEYSQQYSPQYQSQEYYSPQPSASPELITDIAEQIASEKFSEISKIIGNISDFKMISDARISGIDERLKKIESVISQLNSSILKKVGDYGQAVEDLRDEMNSVEESFSKIVNPAVSRVKSRKKEEKKPEKKTEKHISKKSKSRKSKDNFESFLSR